jgi:hypothetical protein
VQAGEWDVNITAWNPLSSDHVEQAIYVGETMKGLAVTDNGLQVGKNQPYSIQISFEKVASDMCVLVDFGATTGDNTDVFLFSNVAECDQYPGVPIAGPVTNPMTVTFTYPNNGQYAISVTAGNFLHTESESLVTTISNARCKKPTLTLFNHHPHNYAPLQHSRKDSLKIEGTATFDCAVTILNKKQWKAARIDETTGNVLATVDLQVEAVKGAQSAVLLMPANFLGYGLFKFNWTVTMDPSKFPSGDIFESTAVTYVRVTKSILKAKIVEGSAEKITRGYGQTVLLQPGVLSYDPDLPAGEPQVHGWDIVHGFAFDPRVKFILRYLEEVSVLWPGPACRRTSAWGHVLPLVWLR